MPLRQQVFYNMFFNISGGILPLIIGIFSVPILLENLGVGRLGIFTLAIGLIGFSGIFDLGIGRALTQLVAKTKGMNYSDAKIVSIIQTAMPFVAILGCVWGVVFWFFAETIVVNVLNIPPYYFTETLLAIYWIAIAIPAILISGSISGVLEGLQMFLTTNKIRVPLGILTILVPTISSFWTQNIGYIVSSLVMVRLIGLFIWCYSLATYLPIFKKNLDRRVDLKYLWKFSGWLSLSNIIGPLMGNADRFYLATLFPPSIIVYYTVPLDTLNRAISLPLAALNAAFPALAHAGNDYKTIQSIVRNTSWLMFSFWAIPLCLATLLLPMFLTAWLGSDFSKNASEIVLYLLLGILINGFSHIPYAILQAAGRADITAKLHVIELPFYLISIFLLVHFFGLKGAAIAWVVRIALDSILLYCSSYYIFKNLRTDLKNSALMCICSVLIYLLMMLLWI